MKTPRQIELLLAAAHMLGLEFTTAQAPGAWPNGSRVVKTRMGPGDAHQLGELATVVGSVGPVPYEGRERTYGYFVLWDKPPSENIPVLVHDGRVALAPVRAPEQTMREGDNCLSREIADLPSDWVVLMTPGHPFRMGCRAAALEAIVERRFHLLLRIPFGQRKEPTTRINDWVVALLRLRDFAERKVFHLNVRAPGDNHHGAN